MTAPDQFDGISGGVFLSLILIECMDAAQVGRSIHDIRSTVDVGDRRSNSAAGTPAAPMTPKRTVCPNVGMVGLLTFFG